MFWVGGELLGNPLTKIEQTSDLSFYRVKIILRLSVTAVFRRRQIILFLYFSPN